MDIDEQINAILDIEGGYSNVPSDNGGETKYGIDKDTFTDFVKSAGLPASSVKDINRDMAAAIYRKRYFDSPQLNLPRINSWKIQLSIFDAAVNRGPGRAARMAQHTLNRSLINQMPEDGILGPKTIAILNDVDDAVFCREFRQLGTLMYAEIALSDTSQQTFLKGWLRRLHLIEDIICEDPPSHS